MRWLFHILEREAYESWLASDAPRYTPSSLATEGFVHASYRGAVVESANLYFPKDTELVVLRIDPRKLDVPVTEAQMPRGPMPHIGGPIKRDAIAAVITLDDIPREHDEILERTLWRLTDAGPERCVCRYENDTLVVETTKIGQRPLSTRRPIDPSRGYAEPDGYLRELLLHKLNEGYFLLEDLARATLLDPLLRYPIGWDASLRAFDMHADAQRLVVSLRGDENGTVEHHLLNLESLRHERIIDRHPQWTGDSWVETMFCHPTRNLIYFELRGHGLWKRDLDTGALENVIPFERHGVWLRASNRERTHFAVVTSAREARLQVYRLDQPEKAVFERPVKDSISLALSPSGRRVALTQGGESNRVRINDVEQRRELSSFELPTSESGHAMRFCSEDELLVTGGRYRHAAVAIIDVYTGAVRHQLESGRTECAVSPDGRTLALAHENASYQHEIRLIDLATRELIKSVPGRAENLSFSRDGTLLIDASFGTVTAHKASSADVGPGRRANLDLGALAAPLECDPAMTSEQLLRDWDGLLGQFPCGSGWLLDNFSLHEPRLQVFAKPGPGGAFERYFVVFQLVGRWDRGVENWVFGIGDEPGWPRRQMQCAAGLSCDEARRSTAHEVHVQLASQWVYDRETHESRPVNPEHHVLHPKLADYRRANILDHELSDDAYARGRKLDEGVVHDIASLLLRERLWHAAPLRLLGVEALPDTWVCLVDERGEDVLAHVSKRRRPSITPRWQKIAAALCGELEKGKLAGVLQATVARTSKPMVRRKPK